MAAPSKANRALDVRVLTAVNSEKRTVPLVCTVLLMLLQDTAIAAALAAYLAGPHTYPHMYLQAGYIKDLHKPQPLAVGLKVQLETVLWEPH